MNTNDPDYTAIRACYQQSERHVKDALGSMRAALLLMAALDEQYINRTIVESGAHLTRALIELEKRTHE